MQGASPKGIGHFEVTGPARPARARAAGLLDLAAAFVVAMVVMPQPLVRGLVMGGGATPASIALFVAVILGIALAVFWVYLVFATLTWGRTPAMYLLDLALDTETRPTPSEAALFATGWVLVVPLACVGVVAAYDPDRGLPARLSGAPTRSTAAPQP